MLTTDLENLHLFYVLVDQNFKPYITAIAYVGCYEFDHKFDILECNFFMES